MGLPIVAQLVNLPDDPNLMLRFFFSPNATLSIPRSITSTQTPACVPCGAGG